jgi:exodeoxyribonuclease VII large subunit
VLTVRMTQTMGRHCLFEQRRLEAQMGKLTEMRLRIRQEWQRTQQAVDRLTRLMCDRVAASRDAVRNRQRELAGLNPVFVVKRGIAMMTFLMQRLERQIMVLGDGRRRRMAALAAQLGQLSPLAILGRGYSILTRMRDGAILRNAGDVQPDEEILARLSQGQLHCSVKRVLPDPLL